jgi:histidinol-phosphatase
MGRRWWAAVGEGAYTRDVDGTVRPIHVSAVSDIADASFSYSDAVGWERHGKKGIKGLNTLLNDSWRTRAYGDFWSHMLVAEGAVDISAEPELAPWDVAALVAIVKEAGGEMTGYDGKSCLTSRAGLATNGLLHEYALGLFN